MSRRHRPVEKRRGRHKKRGSAETLHWNRDKLLPPKPEWMSNDTYERLARLRSSFARESATQEDVERLGLVIGFPVRLKPEDVQPQDASDEDRTPSA